MSMKGGFVTRGHEPTTNPQKTPTDRQGGEGREKSGWTSSQRQELKQIQDFAKQGFVVVTRASRVAAPPAPNLFSPQLFPLPWTADCTTGPAVRNFLSSQIMWQSPTSPPYSEAHPHPLPSFTHLWLSLFPPSGGERSSRTAPPMLWRIQAHFGSTLTVATGACSWAGGEYTEGSDKEGNPTCPSPLWLFRAETSPMQLLQQDRTRDGKEEETLGHICLWVWTGREGGNSYFLQGIDEEGLKHYGWRELWGADWVCWSKMGLGGVGRNKVELFIPCKYTKLPISKNKINPGNTYFA